MPFHCGQLKDPSVIVDTVAAIEPVFGGSTWRTSALPAASRWRSGSKKPLNIPVFHDDQHGTAVVALAALINALKLVKKAFGDFRGRQRRGSGRHCCCRFLYSFGAKDVVLCDSRGVIHPGRTDLNEAKQRIARETNPRQIKGSLADALRGCGCIPGAFRGRDSLAADGGEHGRDAIVFAIANPDPEIMPHLALQAGARVVATGRSDFPNQVNNVLGFPGIFREPWM